VAIDLALECLRRGLPRPEVEVLEVEAGPQGGRVMARGRLHFAAAVSGPILLGRDSHLGMGAFGTT
jgi:CRISPR-associated protein Csb2